MLHILSVAAYLFPTLKRFGAAGTHTASRHPSVGTGMKNIFFRGPDEFIYVHSIPLVLFIVAQKLV